MQQDQRFAVCSHVAAWVLHYSAFRRGVQERRHIADLVGLAGPIYPLRPRVSDGLTEGQVSQMLNELGFRTAIHHVPTVENPFQTLPDVIPIELPGSLISLLEEAGVTRLDQADPRIMEQLERCLTDYLQEMDEEQDGIPAVSRDHPAVESFHQLTDYHLRPYIRSGWPVYAGTSTHAFAICGRSLVNGRPVYFLHDDQAGPHLAAESLPAVSQGSLRYQSADPGFGHRDIAPEHDVVREILEAEPTRWDDARRAIEAVVTAVPSRVLLFPSAANSAARATLRGAAEGVQLQALSATERKRLKSTPDTTASIVMGIDYKIARRRSAEHKKDTVGVRVFSSLQLAEWVIVVEASDRGDAACFAEFVYDASSSDDDPRLLFSRIFCAAVAVPPLDESHPEASILGEPLYPILGIPERVGKVDVL